MSDQLVVNVTPFETRVALLEHDAVAEVFIERKKDRGIVGDIYLGRVQRVLPGMQAAFVEIGHERAAFLYVGDVVPPEDPHDVVEHDHEHGDDADASAAPATEETAHDDAATATTPPVTLAPTGPHKKKKVLNKERRIEELLKQGQVILVQVTKDAIGTKGPRVTCNVSLPGRHLVYMPTHKHIGISRRITDDAERTRLRTILDELKPRFAPTSDDISPVGGFVVRTVSANLPREKLEADAEFLISLWRDVEKRSKRIGAPALVQPELDIVERCARDMFTTDVEKLVIDDEATHKRLVRFVELLDPELVPRVVRHSEEMPVFEAYGIETELGRAMGRRVWLKSGGYLVIDQAEALTAIDVNTGRFVGKRNLEDTILRTNLEASREVAYQLRLRNIGGMVIIDFIDMEDEAHRDRVLQALMKDLEADRARCNVVKMSELGLVEMTRQRTRESLGRQLTETCWYCEGRGTLKSKKTVVYDLFRALARQSKNFVDDAIVVQAHPEVVDLMLGEEGDILKDVEARIGKRIVARPRGSFHQEQFDIFGASLSSLAAKPSKRNDKDKSDKAKV